MAHGKSTRINLDIRWQGLRERCALDLRDLHVEFFYLLDFLGFGLGLRLRFLDRLNGLLVVVLQELVEAQRVLLQHLLTLAECLLPLLRTLLQLANFSSLSIEGHLY